MKVPLTYSPQTRPSAQGLKGFNVNVHTQGLQALSRGLMDFADAAKVVEDRNKEAARFNTLTGYTAFETSVKNDISELQQRTPLDSANYLEQADAVFEKRRAEFLNTVPTELQDEFHFRTEQTKQGVVAGSLKFSLDQQNLFYTNAINERLNTAKNELDSNPDAIDAARADIYDRITSSGLSEIEKARQIKLAEQALEAVSYKGKARKIQADHLRNPAKGIADTTLPAMAGGVLAVIAKRESGGRYDVKYGGASGPQTITSFVDHPRTTVYNPVDGTRSSASGKYQFISGTWDAAAAGAGVRDFSPVSQDRAAWYWAQRTVKQVTGRRVDELIAAGDWGELKRALGTQWEGIKHMSVAEVQQVFTDNAGAVADYSELNSNPNYANLSPEERQGLTNDAEREANAEYNEVIKQQRADEERRINELYLGLHAGTAGQADISTLQDAGILRDYDDVNKAYSILDARNKGLADYRNGEAKLTRGGIWSFDDTDDKKAANALFAEGGAAALENRDADYVNQTLLPRYQKMGMAAPDMINTLTAMSRHMDPATAAFAYDTMRRMREADPVAFEAQMSADVQKQLDFWESRQNLLTPEARVGAVQNRGVDQAQRQAQTVLRSEVKTLMDGKDFDVAGKATAVFNGYFDGYSGDVPVDGRARNTLNNDYRAIFSDNYVLYSGDQAAAEEATAKQLQRIWGLTSIGGTTQLMRFPPEKAGYLPSSTAGWNWIDVSVREQLGLKPETNFTLVADETTEQEITARKGGQDVKPSYLIRYTDEQGVPRYHMQADGALTRIDFDKPLLVKRAEEADFKLKQEQADEQYITRKYREAAQNLRLYGDQSVDYQKTYDFWRGQYDQVQADRKRAAEEFEQMMPGYVPPPTEQQREPSPFVRGTLPAREPEAASMKALRRMELDQ